ncbi:SsgA family sporulation/cell division regulator [Streptomyces sp. NBC_00582]|uniref:SsgA family sporulation/cell division regulator n=1 Tax=Streptomyces sp. NBC_00582 TaxID=2975783 RepID=UPI002E80808E|nr:SsgA family sporulation/cell division regulator [Streptomyces sp. NBC_00582]WUB66343.1 SsgA family sporulation/cell division regulator [Streptomyces sp. NBC_00582]
MTSRLLALQGEVAEPAAAPPPSETAVYISLDQPMGACLLTHDQRELAVPANLRCTSDDPLSVRLVFPASVALDGEEVTWVLARALLEQGLERPADGGGVRVRPHGPAHTTVELRAAEGAALIRFETAALRRFLLRWATVGERVAAPAEAAPVASARPIGAQRTPRSVPPASRRRLAI